jgi:hypothetical protein
MGSSELAPMRLSSLSPKLVGTMAPPANTGVMAEETSDVAKTVRLVSMDRLVVSECFLEAICPNAVQFAEAFTDEPVKR